MTDLTPIPEILLLGAGGTYDKVYDAILGKLVFDHSHTGEMLEAGRVNRSLFRVQNLSLKDSLEYTSVDRELIVETCRRAPEKKIVLTHGTDTKIKTARDLAMATLGKTIVLTGS